jgi:adenylylsulfate kinase-like enzyme
MIVWLTGQPGSGKTTIALEYFYPEVKKIRCMVRFDV